MSAVDSLKVYPIAEAQETATSATRLPSPTALRVRRLRERRREGDVCCSCTLRRGFVEALIAFGWLHYGQQDDRRAVAAAFRGFAARALAVARNGSPDRWYLR
jgi:hypothetical protein